MNSNRSIVEEEQIPFSEMSLVELKNAAFKEGIPPGQSTEDEETPNIAVYMDERQTQMPFGIIENAPFLELFWRHAGADCDGEEEMMEFPNGKTYIVTLKDSRSEQIDIL